jgi:hypothetical protein
MRTFRRDEQDGGVFMEYPVRPVNLVKNFRGMVVK